MAFPRRSSRTPRSRYTLGLLLLTAVSLLVLDLPGTGPLDPVRGALAAVFRPFRSAGDAVFEPFANGWKGAFGYDDVKDENEELKAKLDGLEDQQAEIDRQQAEIDRLKEAAGIKTGDLPAVQAEVTTGPLGTFDRAVEINVGKDDEVRSGMAVVTGGGLLGEIDVARSGSSTVLLLTESSFSVGIRLSNGARGVASGQGPDKPLLLEFERPEDAAAVRKGAAVFTSGIDRSAFPPNVMVGKVSAVDEPADGSEPTIELTPTADLSLIYVKVVLKDPPK